MDAANKDNIITDNELLNSSEHLPGETSYATQLKNQIGQIILNPVKPIGFPSSLQIVLGLIGACAGASFYETGATGGESIGMPGEISGSATIIADGFEGMWIMSEMASQALTQKKTAKNIIRILVSIAFSLLGCIAPTYAAYKYNKGYKKYFAIITLIINFGYKFNGYSNIIKILSAKRSPEYFQKNIYYTKYTTFFASRFKISIYGYINRNRFRA
ncbi:MAG: hypothetical protein KBD83_06415 [Gammaproteobacteria bacterium]|nr:hypothetical protein [Gammaproteobacteria bacterium]